MGMLTHLKRGFRVYTIFEMSTENENTKTANYTDSFAFSLVGCLLRQDKRLFETIEKEIIPNVPEAQLLVDSLQASKRGIVR